MTSLFDRLPFSALPLGKNDIFDLSCEFALSIIENFNHNFSELEALVKRINIDLPTLNVELYRRSLYLSEILLSEYAKLFKIINLSLGNSGYHLKNPKKVFQPLGFSPDTFLQDKIQKIRNSLQHFEERIQEYGNGINPFFELMYKSDDLNWSITLGLSGYKHSGARMVDRPVFEMEKLNFTSYILNGGLKKETVNFCELQRDILRISDLIKDNILDQIKNFDCIAPRDVSVFITNK